MAKPQHVFVLEKGKPKLLHEADLAKQRSGQEKTARTINVIDFLYKKTRINPSNISAGIRVLEAAKKSGQEKIDDTVLGTVIKMVENGKNLAAEWLKMEETLKRATAELRKPSQDVLRLPPPRAGISPADYISIIEVTLVLLKIVVKIRSRRSA